ncbi:MAG: hypothetical protein N2234_00615 [Planctomycetota bacterium]|nr:hypothetical protein [Planctomycetota bacterium]
MVSGFEKVAWVFGVLVILLVVAVVTLLKPSRIVLSQIEHKRVEPEEMENDLAEYARAVENRTRSAGEPPKSGPAGQTTASLVYSNYQDIKKRYPNILQEAYSFADRKLLEKYSTWGEVVQLVKKDTAVFLVDEDEKVVAIRIESLSEDSPLRSLVKLQEGDIIYSICGFLPSNLEESEKLFNGLKDEEYFYLEVEREGRRMLLLYHLPHSK